MARWPKVKATKVRRRNEKRQRKRVREDENVQKSMALNVFPFQFIFSLYAKC